MHLTRIVIKCDLLLTLNHIYQDNYNLRIDYLCERTGKEMSWSVIGYLIQCIHMFNDRLGNWRIPLITYVLHLLSALIRRSYCHKRLVNKNLPSTLGTRHVVSPCNALLLTQQNCEERSPRISTRFVVITTSNAIKSELNTIEYYLRLRSVFKFHPDSLSIRLRIQAGK